MEREITLDAFERAVAGLPSLRWEARALVEGDDASPEYRRVWVSARCPACGADLTMSAVGDSKTDLQCRTCDYRTAHPGVDVRTVIRDVMAEFGLPASD